MKNNPESQFESKLSQADTNPISLAKKHRPSKLRLPGKCTVIFVLICLIFMNYGNYYINDIPQELGDYFTDYFKKTP